MREGFAAVGWTCRVAVVCMVSPRSVVESEANINQWFIFVNNCWLIILVGSIAAFDGLWTSLVLKGRLRYHQTRNGTLTMIDFTRVGTGITVDTVLQPREIFNALPKKNAHKFQYPRDVQSQVWSKWFERRAENSLVLKLNTGSGKTVVGLLALKSCINEGKFPAVYICPDTYLVKQVIDAANELGVEVTDDVHSHRFISGKAILVTNIFKLVNGRSAFGVGDEGVKIKISSLVVDDAHACIGYVEEQFTVDISADSDVYSELYELFRESLHNQCESKAIEIENGNPTSLMQVPYWVWQSKISEVSRILIANSKSGDLQFVWPLVKECPRLSRCVVGSKSIEITPHAIPIHMIPSIIDADRKIFMTATLVDDSILISHFGVNEKFLSVPIIPDSAGDVGDRLILLPQVINPDLADDHIKKYCKYISEYMNVVVIVPSKARADYWRDSADLVLFANNLYEGVDRLKAGKVGLVVLVNKYDGIDLPGDACRLLVIDGFPDVRSKIDRVNQTVLLGSDRDVNQIIQRIEQGMGRGVRSNDDYCVVFLMGRDLTSKLYSQGAMEKFSPGTKAQLTLSEQVSEQIKGKKLSEITETLNYCWSRNSDWITASKGVLATLEYSPSNNLDHSVISLRKAYDYACNGNYAAATETLKTLVNDTADLKFRGLIKQSYAEYTNFLDKSSAQKIQLSAVGDNRRVLKPLEGIQYNKMSGSLLDQAKACSEFLSGNFQDPNKLIIEINGVLDGLDFKADSSENFERRMKEVARYLGFHSQRPEEEYQKGPDILWKVGELNYFVIECKNEAVVQTVTKYYCNQLNGSCEWFEERYDHSCGYTPILVHPYSLFEYAASPNPKVRVMTLEKLREFREAVRDFIKAVASSNEIGNAVAIRQKLIAAKLRASDIVDIYTVPFRVKSR